MNAPPPVVYSSGSISPDSDNPLPPRFSFVTVGHLFPIKNLSPKNESTIKQLRRIPAPAFAVTQDREWFWDPQRADILGRVRPLLSSSANLGELIIPTETLERLLEGWAKPGEVVGPSPWVVTLPLHNATRPEEMVFEFLNWLASLPETARAAKSCQPFEMPTKHLVSFDTNGVPQQHELNPPTDLPGPTFEVTSFIHAHRLYAFTHGVPPETVHYWTHKRPSFPSAA